MSAVARWSFPIASIAVACLGALVMPACGSSPDLVDRSAAAASTAVPAARAPDAPGDAAKDDAGDEAKIQIKTISNRADLISGGDALVEIALSKAKLASSLRVQLNGRDVSSAFAVRGNGRILGLVSGLVRSIVRGGVDGDRVAGQRHSRRPERAHALLQHRRYGDVDSMHRFMHQHLAAAVDVLDIRVGCVACRHDRLIVQRCAADKPCYVVCRF